MAYPGRSGLMGDQNGNENGGMLALAVKIVACLVVIGVPTGALALLMPHRASDILQIAIYVLFAASALMAGASWSQPSYASGIRWITAAILAAVILGNPLTALASEDELSILDFLQQIGLRAAFVLTPFLAGRFLYWIVKKRIAAAPKDLFS